MCVHPAVSNPWAIDIAAWQDGHPSLLSSSLSSLYLECSLVWIWRQHTLHLNHLLNSSLLCCVCQGGAGVVAGMSGKAVVFSYHNDSISAQVRATTHSHPLGSIHTIDPDHAKTVAETAGSVVTHHAHCLDLRVQYRSHHSRSHHSTRNRTLGHTVPWCAHPHSPLPALFSSSRTALLA